MTMVRFEFRNIPKESKFAVFDKDSTENRKKFWVIPPGDEDVEWELEDWENPHYVLRCKGYWIPGGFVPLDATSSPIVLSGKQYYIDITRERIAEELNQESIESLIHSIHGSAGINGRQLFFVALVALQSYFEYLVHGMLVLSGHMHKPHFERLRTHNKRLSKAFSKRNSSFFSDRIEICPGKDGLGSLISDPDRAELRRIFDTVRIMRNKVVHAWSFQDVTKVEIESYYNQLKEYINIRLPDDEFYTNAAFVFVRLYARANYIRTQLSYFQEKEKVRRERASRGY